MKRKPPIWELFERTGFPLTSLLLPGFLALLAAVFEGLSVALLLPAVHGALHRDITSGGSDWGAAFLKAMPLQFQPVEGHRLFILVVVLLLATSILRIICGYFSSLEFARRARRLTAQLRQLTLRECLGYGKEFFDNSQSGQLLHVHTSAIVSLTERLVSLQDLLGYLLMLFAYLVVMLWISWRLTICVVVLLVLMEAFLRGLMARLKTTSREVSEAHKAASGKIAEILSNVSLVKASSSERLELQAIADLDAHLEGMEGKAALQGALVRPVQEVVFLGAMVAVLAGMALRGAASPDNAASLLVFAYLVRRASGCLIPLGRSATVIATMHGAAVEVLNIIDHRDKPILIDGRLEFTGLLRELAVNDLSFGFPNGAQVLSKLSFRVQKGQTVAIVGPSGAGKTTLINLLLRFYDPQSGSIQVDGHDIREFTFRSLRSRIALVSQDTPHFNDSIRRNVAYPLNGEVPEKDVLEALKKARLLDFAMNLPQGIDTPVGDRGVKLSGGERQRLAIARAFLRNAEILVLDEATSSLDTQTESLIQESIDELLRGKTAIVIAHRLSTIKNADSIIVIDDGRVLESGTRQELLAARGRFFEYWQRQRFD